MIVVAHCRAGFEGETAIDLTRAASAAGVDAKCTTVVNSAYVVALLGALDLRRWRQALVDMPPIFARSVFAGSGPHVLVAAEHTKGQRGGADRVTPIVAAIEALASPASDLWVEFADTNDGKEMSTLARALTARIEGELRRRGLLLASAPNAKSAIAPRNRKRLHVFLPDGATAYVGSSIGESGSPWPMGIPRLKMPHAAPSRSTLKLVEALITFLGDSETAKLRAGMRAVDLGAAPGGWTWQLAHRGVRVTAVDNGPLKGEVASDPLVTHLRSDGLRFRPKRQVDWVTCDIVEQPLRIATLMADWIADGAARRALFNLKLPMKRRYDEVLRCIDAIDARVSRAGVDATLRVRQLYHDRAEVTAYLARVD
ncbi:MAG: 23S rRNA (cytidine(2498)-2'-O)-methyltransferase RlmM [Betaproteobacteria bacterium]